MKITFDRKSDALSVRFVEEKSLSRWLQLIFASALFAVCEIYAARNLPIIAPTVVSIIPLAYLFAATRNLFGAYELEISTASLTVKRRIGPFASSRSYKREDVDWLAFSPEVIGYRSRQDSSLAIHDHAGGSESRVQRTEGWFKLDSWLD